MLKIFCITCLTGLLLCGCSSERSLVQSAGAKNLDLSGYVMLGEIQTATPETSTPLGRLLLGRVTYRSRLTGIPQEQKVPDSAAFRAVQTESLLGTRELIVEYDFTASNSDSAAAAVKALEKICTLSAAQIEH
jgi:hypothetical protein